jgi:hypothetical protein
MGPVFNTPDAISAYYGLRPKPGWMYEAAKRIFEARLTGKPGRATIRGARSDWTAEGISLAGVASAWLIVLGSSSVNID